MLGDVLGLNLNVALRSMLRLILCVGYLFTLSVPLTLLSLGSSLAFFTVTFFFSRYQRVSSRAVQEATADSNHVAEQSLSLARTVRAFGAEVWEEQRFSRVLSSRRNGTTSFGRPAVSSARLHSPLLSSRLLAPGVAMKVLIKPRIQKDKWSLYWKTSMCTKTELLDEFELELDDTASIEALKTAVMRALGWPPVAGLLPLEGFEEPWELWAHRGIELPEDGTLAAAGVADGAAVVAVRKVLVAEGAVPPRQAGCVDRRCRGTPLGCNASPARGGAVTRCDAAPRRAFRVGRSARRRGGATRAAAQQQERRRDGSSSGDVTAG
jgi:hypothetical protein